MALKKYHVSKNLFDKDTMSVPWYIDTQGRVVSSSGGSYSIVVPCEANQSLICSFPTIPSAHLLRAMDFSTYPSVGDLGTNYNSQSGGGSSMTFTTSATAKYVMFFLYNSASGAHPDMTAEEFLSQTMLNTGSTALPYEPYGNTWVDSSYRRHETATDVVINLPVQLYTDGQPVSSYTLKGNTSVSGTPSPQNPVTITGSGNKTANLFNINGTWTKQNPSDTVTVSGNSVTITSAYFAYQVITVEPNTDYTLSFTSEGNYTLVRGYNSSTFSSANQIFSANRSPISFNTGNTTTLYVLFYSGTGTTGTTTYSDIMLSEGAAIPFEPYGKYKISILKGSQALTPIYLSQQLMAIANTKDEYSSSGTATYSTYKLVLTGQEEGWTVGTTSGHQRATLTLPVQVGEDSNGYCTHYKFEYAVANGNAYIASNFNMLAIIDDTNAVDKTTFLAYLAAQYAAGTPVTVYYILATPTTETVTAPTITTTGGEVTLDVDTTVKPSELDLTYHGWHEHEPLKRENGQWE